MKSATDLPSELKSYGFLLLPEYSMIALTSAVEPLRMANHLSQQPLYEWKTISSDGMAVCASNGISTLPTTSIEKAKGLDVVFVCGGMNIEKHSADDGVIRWLQELADNDVGLGGLCTGTYTLAKADLLGKRRCTIHWELIDQMGTEFPSLNITNQLFEIDEGRFTCAGGQAPLDMMLGVIHHHHGGNLALNICDEFLYERIRDSHDVQRTRIRNISGPKSSALTSVITLMAANIEDPVSLPTLANHAKMSGRHLQRLFKSYLKISPNRYYMNMRLERAREMVLLSNKSILDIGKACGFYSAPHFSKVYRLYFGITPRDDRRGGVTPTRITSSESSKGTKYGAKSNK